ncbi:MAG: UDP-glucose 4-epimerase GalE, partial [Dechloromonas agitata]|nr:UDP-glucose 4-epimerase GalE [Dechloromonas agitata]
MILVTGGAGYIGSHTCVEMLNAGHEVVVFDNFSDSHTEALKCVQAITGKTLQLVEGAFRDQKALEDTIRRFECMSIIHFTCLKAVGESVEKPLKYYDNNVIGTHRLLQAMGNCGVKALVFSSSVAVYGESQLLPPTKGHLFLATNPYGRTKLFIEEVLRDMYCSDSTWQIAILHYFNSVGVHESGLICEDPQEGMPNNLMSCVTQVAVGRRECLRIWGNDHQMLDGTGGRDFIHVIDLAQGHLKAIECLDSPQCIA